jgi:hypothetical protein
MGFYPVGQGSHALRCRDLMRPKPYCPFSACHAKSPRGHVTPRSGVFPGQSKVWSKEPPSAESYEMVRRARLGKAVEPQGRSVVPPSLASSSALWSASMAQSQCLKYNSQVTPPPLHAVKGCEGRGQLVRLPALVKPKPARAPPTETPGNCATGCVQRCCAGAHSGAKKGLKSPSG